MNSKEALEKILSHKESLGYDDAYEPPYYCGEFCIGEIYQEEEKIILKDLDRLEKLEKENKELRKSIKSWNETAGNLLKENIKLKKAIEILKDSLGLTLYHNKPLNTYSVELMCFEEHLGKHINQEEYGLLKEVFKIIWQKLI